MSEDILNLVGMDMIMLEDMRVIDYLKEDTLNFVILDDNTPIFTNVNDIDTILDDGLTLECMEVGSYNYKNVIFDN